MDLHTFHRGAVESLPLWLQQHSQTRGCPRLYPWGPLAACLAHLAAVGQWLSDPRPLLEVVGLQSDMCWVGLQVSLLALEWGLLAGPWTDYKGACPAQWLGPQGTPVGSLCHLLSH